MTPDHEEYKQGSTQWGFNEEGIAYQLSHHAVRKPDEHNPEGHPGIWCFYLMLHEQMFPADVWQDEIRTTHDKSGFGNAGKGLERLNGWYGGITLAEAGWLYDRREKRWIETAKVGCDYAHSWDHDAGYPHTLNWVKRDAKATAIEFANNYPNRYRRCAYSGIWGPLDDFYTARNGALVSLSKEADIMKGATKTSWPSQWARAGDEG